jgi:hypothetical protein
LKVSAALVITALVVLIAFALTEAVSLAGQIGARLGGRGEDEIGWLEAMEPIRVWDPGRHAQIERRYREWIERELRADRIDRAVRVVRMARERARTRREPLQGALVELGLETYTRAADRVERHGRLSLAADWNDTLFVFAVRSPEPRFRAAATAAFVEGLELRTRDGRPCEALARVAWAKRGLGGEIPGFEAYIEENLGMRCEQSRRGTTGRARAR